MSDEREEQPEGNNPSHATPRPHPDFIIRHDQAIKQNTKEEAPKNEKDGQAKSDSR
jgi:hypothetical protein